MANELRMQPDQVRALLVVLTQAAATTEELAQAIAATQSAISDSKGFTVQGLELGYAAAQQERQLAVDAQHLARDAEATMQAFELADASVSFAAEAAAAGAATGLGGATDAHVALTQPAPPTLDDEDPVVTAVRALTLADLRQALDQSALLSAEQRAALQDLLDVYDAHAAQLTPEQRQHVDRQLEALLQALTRVASATPTDAAGADAPLALSALLLGTARGMGATAAGLAADDVTGVGVADDPGIPPLLGLTVLLLVTAGALRVAEGLEATPTEMEAYATAVTAVTIDEVYQTLDQVQVLQMTPEQQERYRKMREAALQQDALRRFHERKQKALADGWLDRLKAEDKAKVATDPTGRLEDLSFDPAVGRFRVDEGEAALEAERQNVFDGPITRDTHGAQDFVDGNGDHWDLKRHEEGVNDIVAGATGTAGEQENVLVKVNGLTVEQEQALQKAVDQALDAWQQANPGKAPGKVKYLRMPEP